jgi:hypothetical protein
MSNYLKQLFSDKKIVQRVRERMPDLFQLAEADSSRAGKLGMEVGSVRERIIIALLIYKFGEENVKTDTPITESEIDAILFDNPVSIKTISGDLSGVKLIWTVDPQKALEFSKNYTPKTDILLVNINWGAISAFYYFPKEGQMRVFKKLGTKKYLKLPKKGTNPRGVEITKEAVELLVTDKDTMLIDINWERREVRYNIYGRWVELWKK